VILQRYPTIFGGLDNDGRATETKHQQPALIYRISGGVRIRAISGFWPRPSVHLWRIRSGPRSRPGTTRRVNNARRRRDLSTGINEITGIGKSAWL